MTRFVAAVAIACALLGAVRAQETPIEAKSRIDAVTVYANSATVTRAAEVNVKVGRQTVAFNGLPGALSDDSVRAFASGAPKVKIMGVEVKTVYLEQPLQKELAQLREEYETLADRMSQIDHEMSAYAAEMDFARNMARAAAAKAPLEAVRRKVDPKELAQMAEFIRETIRAAAKKHLALETQKRELARKQAVIQARMNELSRQRSTISKSVLVTLMAERAMKVSCSITYLIPQATWRPAYDVRYLPKTNQVEMVYYGVVSQRTGEDWNNVELEMSTATPSTAVSMPEFRPAVVYPYGQRVVREMMEKREAAAQPMRRRFNRAKKALEDEEKFDMAGRLAPGGAIVAGVVQRFTSVTFKHPKRETIPSDGRPHKSIVTIQRFGAKLEYVSTPALSQFVYLRASLVNTSKYPILPGEMSVYVDANFIGKAAMKSVASNEKFQVYFGPDKDLKIERKVVKMHEEGPTMFRSSKKVSKSFHIKLQNFKDRPVTVTVVDAIPVSWTEMVKVTLVDCTPKPSRDKDKIKEQEEMGKLTWVIKLAPRTKEEIRFKYDIEHPQAYRVNLEKWSQERLKQQMEQYKK